ncbi:hypothetical protein B0186_04105 [Canicola haemoglobinophilus]|uniref:Holin n=1 Tax=Canicola haemoglobinophilus TaxID=733 RepID=A0A1V4B215_9PAST|nr:hypothetical protein B0186_04105 [Canicola haemoglobinophilus]STO54415.1 Uncharacterised protein [Canicola haemoglobinophilus]STO60112.1 Uncharacterised protein [Canicola haemoglobinophilus]STO68949.1 Uncharacterised protein [Canicola haemoglobinophilus]
MSNIMRDSATQSYLWNGLTGWLAWLGDQQNLMLISLALGILTALVNMYSKFKERKIKLRQEEREEEKHRLEMQQLRELGELKKQQLQRGLRDEPIKNSG